MATIVLTALAVVFIVATSNGWTTQNLPSQETTMLTTGEQQVWSLPEEK